MDRQAIKQQIIYILTSQEHLGLAVDASTITDETSLIHDLALESLRILDLIVALENRFQLSIETDGPIRDLFDRLANLVDYIAARV